MTPKQRAAAALQARLAAKLRTSRPAPTSAPRFVPGAGPVERKGESSPASLADAGGSLAIPVAGEP